MRPAAALLALVLAAGGAGCGGDGGGALRAETDPGAQDAGVLTQRQGSGSTGPGGTTRTAPQRPEDGGLQRDGGEQRPGGGEQRPGGGEEDGGAARIGEPLPSAPPKEQSAPAPGETLRFTKGRCRPSRIELGRSESLNFRRSGAQDVRFRIPGASIDVPITNGAAVSLLLPAGSYRFECRPRVGRVSRGTLEISRR